MTLIFISKLVLSYPGGSPLCHANQIFPPGNVANKPFNFTCTELNCAISAPENIWGFVISGAESYPTIPANAKRINAQTASCVTHNQKLNQNQIDVGIELNSASRTLYATVVYERQSGNHVYQTEQFTVPSPSDKIFIVGGGPGGLGAAYYFESIGQNYTLLEQGPEIDPSFWLQPIKNSSELRSFFPLGPGNSDELQALGQGLGGTQNVNGAVYAPGTARDLANSLGVSLAHAQKAQEDVGQHVFYRQVSKSPSWVNVSMMWEPINASDPDNANFTNHNTKMSRRSLAKDFNPVYGTVLYNKKVNNISETHLLLENETFEYSKVILAAGALSSPQLLNKTEFEVLNHGFNISYDFNSVPPEIHFEYPLHNAERKQLGNIETMIGEVPSGNFTFSLTIEMEMEYPFRYLASTIGNGSLTKIENDKAQFNKYDQDPWHYIASVAHTEMKVPIFDNVYIGDASALKTPFNCHTSMPAAAAGNLAAKRLMGMNLAEPPKIDMAPAYETRAYLFISGLWILIAGVVAHVYARLAEWDAGNYVHYLFQFIGTLLITFAAVLSATQSGQSSATQFHRVLGWTTIGFLWLNVLGGIALSSMKSYPASTGMIHRYSGYTILILLSIMAFTATYSGLDIDKIANAVSFATIAGIVLIFAFQLPEKIKNDYSKLM